MIGYARAEEGHDEDQQRSSLAALGVEPDHIHIDRGLRGTRNDLPARTAMLADLTVGDVIAVTGLERLARSAAELGEVAGVIEQRGASLRVGSTVYDPDTETGRTAFAMLTQTFPDFQAGSSNSGCPDRARKPKPQDGIRAARRSSHRSRAGQCSSSTSPARRPSPTCRRNTG